MPELPEVETIRRGLSDKIVGKRLNKVESDNPKSFQGKATEVIDRTVLAIERRAKVIRIQLSEGKNLLFHLKMTGQLIYLDKDRRFAGGHPSHDWHANLPNKHTRIVFTFDDESKLFFNDLRKFGWCKVLDDAEIEKVFAEYGPEPFSPDFTWEYLFNRSKSMPKKTVKQFIMDQQIIAGIGNIYADESLFLTKLMPSTKVGLLKEADWKELIKNIKEVLEKGILYGGTTDSDYVNIEGKKGGMQNYLNVYHRTGEKCPNCEGTIDKMKIGGRGTYFCRSCQRELK